MRRVERISHATRPAFIEARLRRAEALLRIAERGLTGLGMQQTTDRVIDAVLTARALLPKDWKPERDALEQGVQALYRRGKFEPIVRAVRWALRSLRTELRRSP